MQKGTIKWLGTYWLGLGVGGGGGVTQIVLSPVFADGFVSLVFSYSSQSFFLNPFPMILKLSLIWNPSPFTQINQPTIPSPLSVWFPRLPTQFIDFYPKNTQFLSARNISYIFVLFFEWDTDVLIHVHLGIFSSLHTLFNILLTSHLPLLSPIYRFCSCAIIFRKQLVYHTTQLQQTPGVFFYSSINAIVHHWSLHINQLTT